MLNDNDDLEKNLQKIIATTRTFDNLQKMMRTSRTFDEQLAEATRKSERAIGGVLIGLLRRAYQSEKRDERILRTRARVAKLHKPRTLYGKFVSKLPSKYRNLPLAFRRNPQLVVKYFAGMIIGRILAILLYLLAALIPAIPVPESAQGLIGKPVKVVGSMLGGVRGVLTDPTVIATAVSNIPTDINKLLQKIGEFFQFYGKRVSAFMVKAVRHPKLAYQDMIAWSRANVRFFVRLCRGAVAMTFSLVMIKLAMVFLLPLFGGIAITIAGLKISILLIVVVRMIVDKVGEFIGTKVFGKLSRKVRQYNESQKESS